MLKRIIIVASWLGLIALLMWWWMHSKPEAAASAASPVAADPRSGLKTAIPEAIRLLAAKDYLGYYHEFLPPDDEMNKLPPAQRDKFIQDMVDAGPQFANDMNDLLKEMQAIQGRKPALNAAGDEVTYDWDATHGDGKLHWVKEHGLWYVATGGTPDRK